MQIQSKGNWPSLSCKQNKLRLNPRQAVCATAVAAIISSSAWAAQFGGVLNAKITVNFAEAPPAGSSVNCNLSLISDDVNHPSENAYTSANVNGSQAICTMVVHYLWNVAATSQGTLAYGVSGPSQSSSGIYITGPMPPNGTNLSVNIVVQQ